MHPSALALMKSCIDDFMPPERHYKVLDFGSFMAKEGTTHRDLLADHDCSVLGVDIQGGRNVDVVMRRPYRIPVPSNSADVVLSGQVFEHIAFPFTSMLELRRVVRPGGLIIITAPSRGHRHNVYDCWRYYPDSMRSLAAFSALRLERVQTDFPPKTANGRLDYGNARTYWGDTVGVFRKPRRSPRARLALLRLVMRSWSNRIGDLEAVPIPPRP